MLQVVGAGLARELSSAKLRTSRKERIQIAILNTNMHLPIYHTRQQLRSTYLAFESPLASSSCASFGCVLPLYRNCTACRLKYLGGKGYDTAVQS